LKGIEKIREWFRDLPRTVIVPALLIVLLRKLITGKNALSYMRPTGRKDWAVINGVAEGVKAFSTINEN